MPEFKLEIAQSTAPEELTFDGERFVPGAGVEITYDHWLRYHFARQLTQGKRVLDIACGEGYGAAYLAGNAERVHAFDRNPKAVAHARAKYGAAKNLDFKQAEFDAYLASVEDGAFDVVTCFEFIEHIPEEAQGKLLAEIRRVLAKGGVALISTPDKLLYTDQTHNRNEFHIRELYRDEFEELLGRHFPHARLLDQATFTGSSIFERDAQHGLLAQMSWTDLIKLKGSCKPGLRAAGKYLVAVVSDSPVDKLPLQTMVLLDPAKKLIGEELYSTQVELDRLKRKQAEDDRADAELRRSELELRAQVREQARELEAARQKSARLEAELAEARAALSSMEALSDRMLSMVAKRNEELTQAQRTQSECAMLRGALDHAHQEIARLSFLDHMLSVKLMFRAKRYWDRAPLLKKVVKGALKPLL